MSGTTKRWLGNAASVTDVWTITLSGTVVSQTYSVTINGKSVTYTANGSSTVSIILQGLAAASVGPRIHQNFWSSYPWRCPRVVRTRV